MGRRKSLAWITELNDGTLCAVLEASAHYRTGWSRAERSAFLLEATARIRRQSNLYGAPMRQIIRLALPTSGSPVEFGNLGDPCNVDQMRANCDLVDAMDADMRNRATSAPGSSPSDAQSPPSDQSAPNCGNDGRGDPSVAGDSPRGGI